MALVAHALQVEMEMITHSNKTGHESVARSPAGRQEGHPRIERSVPILKERKFTDDTTTDAKTAGKQDGINVILGSNQ